MVKQIHNLFDDNKYRKPFNYMRKFNLVYRGTRDGFDSKAIFTKCRYKCPTLTIIKSESEKKKIIRLFGGYTDI
jgi:hypothetical protein